MDLQKFFDVISDGVGNFFGLSDYIPDIFIGLAGFVFIYLVVKTFREFL